MTRSFAGRCMMLCVPGMLLAACSGETAGPNRRPVAVLSVEPSIEAGAGAVLVGDDSSDPDGDALTFHWEILAAPARAGLGGVLAPGPAGSLPESRARFSPQHGGAWVVALRVHDGRRYSLRAVATVRVAADTCSTDEDCDNDDLWCNGEERCENGGCVSYPNECADGDPCTQDNCDEELDRCDHPPVDEPPGTEGPAGDPTCSDGMDNDCDGLTDADDTACLTCTGDGDCDDGNPCTLDSCEQGSCSNQPLADGTACDDGLFCTVDDACADGRCTGAPRDCSGLEDACNAGVCDEQQAACVAAPFADGTACDDGAFCTVDDTCHAGVCTGDARDCSAVADACNQGVCDEESDSCTAAPMEDGTACDDGQYCNVGETCQAGVCQGGAPRDCSASGGSCIDGTCDEEQDQCVGDPVANGTPCDDEQFCTQGETCQDGMCQGGTPRDCSGAGGVCMQGVCDDDQDACVGEPLQDGTSCDDGLVCTENDVCTGGACDGTQLDCSHLDDQCLHGVCQETSGGCTAVPVNQGDACDDGLFCTVDDACDQGVCLGRQRDCSHLDDACHQGVCNEQSGACEAEEFSDGTACDDGLWCTVTEECQDGVCTGTQEQGCLDDPHGCGTGYCDHDLDQCAIHAVADGTPCDDGSACTLDDACLDGSCQGDPCPLGCNTAAEPERCYQLDPSNLAHDFVCRPGAPAFVATDGIIINTRNGTIGGSPVTNYQPVDQGGGAPAIAVFWFSSIDIPEGTTVVAGGDRALALVACGDVSIAGFIDASANGINPGPGGFRGGQGNNYHFAPAQWGGGYQEGGGGPGVREGSPFCHTPGGGGGFGRDGGKGGDGVPDVGDPRPGGVAGKENGSSDLVPLVGGSGGGGAAAWDQGGDGGGGGGAVQISAGGAIWIGPGGGITVGGAGGGLSNPDYYGAGGGGGAGGAILLEGASVTVEGTLAANGGGGGGGRTDYWEWSPDCPEGTPRPGEEGPWARARAAGGLGCSAIGGEDAGDGGRGGGTDGDANLGEPGDDAHIAGGGGGSAGRIRINTYQDGQHDLGSASLSPDATGSEARCTTGPVALW